MHDEIRRAIATRQAELDKGFPYPLQLAKVPRNGKVLEPVIGRQRAEVSGEQRPATDMYEQGREPHPEPGRSETLEVLQGLDLKIPIQLREDLPPHLASKPVTVRLRAVRFKNGRSASYEFEREFKPGEPVSVPLQEASHLLNHTQWGRLLEEVATNGR